MKGIMMLNFDWLLFVGDEAKEAEKDVNTTETLIMSKYCLEDIKDGDIYKMKTLNFGFIFCRRDEQNEDDLKVISHISIDSALKF